MLVFVKFNIHIIPVLMVSNEVDVVSTEKKAYQGGELFVCFRYIAS